MIDDMNNQYVRSKYRAELLVRSVMDEVSYERADGENRLTLLKIW